LFRVDDDLPSTRRVPPLSAPPDAAPEPVLTSFSVQIRYVEPGYAARVHADPRTYSFAFPVRAPSAEEAVRVARERFRETWLASGVGWEREIVEVEVSVVGDG
jgi:hypothetical protein